MVRIGKGVQPVSHVGSSQKPSGRRARPSATFENLEGRALLSHAVAHLTPVHVAQVETLRAPHNAHPGPILNEIGQGYAVKSVRFYPFYTGAKRTELNAAAAKAVIDGQGNLRLTGVVVGPIISAPTKPEQEAIYEFLIDRGYSGNSVQIPGRPNIKYDTIVSVDVSPNGVTGAVSTSQNGLNVVVGIDPSSIQLGRDTVKVVLPQSLVSQFGTTGMRAPTVVFATLARSTTTFDTSFASFVPEFRGFSVASGPGHRHLY